MSKWWYPYILMLEDEVVNVGLDRLPKRFAEGAEDSLAREFFGHLFQKREKYIDHENQYCMYFIYHSSRF